MRDKALCLAVARPDGPDCAQIDALDTGEIVAVLCRYATALMVGIDATDAAEVVFGDLGVPLVQRELVGAPSYPQPLQGNPGHDRTLAAAD